LARSVVVVAAGAAAGLLLAVSMTRALTQLLFDVRPLDPTAFAGAAGLLVAIVLAASLFPARHAARTDPAAILRIE
jgi:ABC-type antimicrobial peptide transport system permease subunit